ncbi:glycosyltransferase family 4 protein, partial [bacterium]|nr:glycosyltransferase family 4 protein [bacterium]
MKTNVSDARRMRIGIDVRGLEMESSLRRGIGRYTTNLIRAMCEIAPQHRYVLLGEKLPWRVSHLDSLCDHPAAKYEIFWPAFSRDLDVLLLTDPSPVACGRTLLAFPLQGLPCAAILYDLIPLAFREVYLDPDPRLKAEYSSRIEELPHVAARLLTISEFVASDAIERLGLPREQVVPILGGLDEVFRDPPSADEIRAIRERYELSDPYFFYTGGTDFRKNLPVLLEAFRRVRQAARETVKLVLAGEFDPAWRTEIESHPHIRELGDDLVLPGYVTDADLRGLYGGATAFVFPSLYEGFGLPALEAMACRCPVIAANGTSLREIIGNAGILVRPESVDEVAAAMMGILVDPRVGEELRERGLARAKRYSWIDVAAKTLAVLGELARPQSRTVVPTRKLKVLIQNRADAFAAPGGDTVVMEHLYRTLRHQDVEVAVAAGTPDLSNVDIVHLVNLTLAGVGREVSDNACRQNVPYVVTTLFEDWPRYMERSFAALAIFKDYIENGYNERSFRSDLRQIHSLSEGQQVGNAETAQRAAMLFACGESEAARLAEAYPSVAEHVSFIKFGIGQTG